ncbi:MAG: CdaR family protein [Bdellovibrionota bacterium]
MKLFSLALACGLWFVIRGEKLTEMSVNIPVKFENLPAGTIMNSDVPNTIRLKLRGSKLRMAKMNEDFFTPYVINLEGSKMGHNSFGFMPKTSKCHFGVSINRIQPQNIHVLLSKIMTKPVTVEPRIVGNPMPGFSLKSVQINPTQVQIQGDQAQLELINVLGTEEINLDGRSTSFQGDYDVDLRGYRANLLVSTVHVQVEIEEKTGTETILSVPVKWTEAQAEEIKKDGARIQPETVTMKVSGRLTQVFEIVKNPISPTLNAKQLNAALRGNREAVIFLDLPVAEGMKFEVEPKAVKLIYEPKQPEEAQPQEQPQQAAPQP